MRSGLIKLAHSLDSQALVNFPVNACLESGIKEVIVVVGYQAAKVKSILGEGFKYAFQDKRLGTGDALKRATPLLKDFKGELVVLPGDAPFINSSILIKLIQHHQKRKPVATVLTALLSDSGHYGRVIRDGYGQVKKIAESKDATPEELKIKEVNSGIYCFNAKQLLPVLPLLKCNNARREYYLTDVIELFYQKDLKVETLRVKNSNITLEVILKNERELGKF